MQDPKTANCTIARIMQITNSIILNIYEHIWNHYSLMTCDLHSCEAMRWISVIMGSSSPIIVANQTVNSSKDRQSLPSLNLPMASRSCAWDFMGTSSRSLKSRARATSSATSRKESWLKSYRRKYCRHNWTKVLFSNRNVHSPFPHANHLAQDTTKCCYPKMPAVLCHIGSQPSPGGALQGMQISTIRLFLSFLLLSLLWELVFKELRQPATKGVQGKSSISAAIHRV